VRSVNRLHYDGGRAQGASLLRHVTAPVTRRSARSSAGHGRGFRRTLRVMSREIRPRFEIETDEDPRAVLDRVSKRLRSGSCPLCGVVAEGRAELYVPPARQRLWSPELRVEVRDGERGSVLEGRYAPHPHVWMAYAAILAVTAIAATAALTFALAEWMMREPMVALYALLPLALVGGGTYTLAFVGQRLATSEMDELRAFLDDVVRSSVPLPSGVRSRVPEAGSGVARRVG
jgi:hypothetical protein